MNHNVEIVEKIINNVGKVIIGKRQNVYEIVKGMIAGGHILIEDVPGVGKTTLIKAIKQSFDLSYSRIQFTPDLLPSDITGISIYNSSTGTFIFNKGPVFSNIVLADEINRTSPKTQSALLEVMEEMQVSEGGKTYELEKPFFIMATENPIEYEGTFSLPEAQLDRFIIKVHMGYPINRDEAEILRLYRKDNPLEELTPVATKADLENLQRAVKEIKVKDDINKFIVKIVDGTRNHRDIFLGGSTRASLALLRISQATALIEGRDYVIPEDVKSSVKLVLNHRIILTNSATARGVKVEDILDEILSMIIVPKVREND
ncbi:MAG: MoxR family ATPase [Clostridium sp.]|uniref:AAA family ATPase n=1 Tax=Clostridium culturomicium TaxID=1499683 RepID=UPI00058F3973|nr:MoxR family ATPase [Clostridium culturomicium]MDU4890910.1 MoxR family ATPase [Clostridium sp.]MDU7082128.1 MoxR family ATPase [Clostridium sp.]